MTELSEARAATTEQPEADATARLATANKRAQDFLFGAQRAMFDEMVFVSNELLDRARTELTCWRSLCRKWRGPIRSKTSRRCTRNAASIRSTLYGAIVSGSSSTRSARSRTHPTYSATGCRINTCSGCHGSEVQYPRNEREFRCSRQQHCQRRRHYSCQARPAPWLTFRSPTLPSPLNRTRCRYPKPAEVDRSRPTRLIARFMRRSPA